MSVDKIKPITEKQDVISESKNEQNNLSKEKLQSMDNREFLSISKKKRLQYITRNNINSNDLVKKDLRIKNLEFSFTFNWKYNKELYLMTTAWQVLPEEVNKVISWNIEYERKWLAWEFFTKWSRRLIIREWTKIEIGEIRTKEDVKKIETENKKVVENFKEDKKTNRYKELFPDILSEAVKRNIDIKFALVTFSEKIKNLPIISTKRQVLIEEMFTEYDREKWRKSIVEVNRKDNIENYWIDNYNTKSEFYNLVTSRAKLVESKYGVPWEITLWQSILESWHWTSLLAKKYNNFFGHTARTGQQSVRMMDNWNPRNFVVYSSVLEWLEAHWKFLTKWRYDKAFKYTWNNRNPLAFLKILKKEGYAEDPDYVSKVVSTLKARWIDIS